MLVWTWLFKGLLVVAVLIPSIFLSWILLHLPFNRHSLWLLSGSCHFKARKESRRERDRITGFQIAGFCRRYSRSERAAWTEGEAESLQRRIEAVKLIIHFFLTFPSLVNEGSACCVFCCGHAPLPVCWPVLCHLSWKRERFGSIYCFSYVTSWSI